MSCTNLSNPSRVMLLMWRRCSAGHRTASSGVVSMSTMISLLCNPNHFLTKWCTSLCVLQVMISMSHCTGLVMSLSGTSSTSYSPSLYIVVSTVGLCSMLNWSYTSLCTSDVVPNVPVTHIRILKIQ